MADRTFLVGDTVDLVVRVSRPGTRDPADPAEGVTLLGLARGATQVLTAGPQPFDRAEAGHYWYSLQTDGWEPGAYSWLASARKDALAVSQVEDTFVLVARATPLA